MARRPGAWRRAVFAPVALAILVLAGCAAPQPALTLPAAASRPGPNATSAAIHGAAEAFAAPSRLRGDPARMAIAVAQLEYLAGEIPSGRDLRNWGITGPALQGARYEVRAWLGIPDAAPSQPVIDALAVAAGPAALPADLFPAGGAEVWRRLAAPPRLPQANAATAMALRSWEFGPEDVMDFVSLGRR